MADTKKEGQDEDEDLDLSWTKEYIQTDSIHVREPMSKIKIHFVYIDNYSKIDRVLSEYYSLDIFENDSNSGSILSQSRLLQIIQSKRQILDKRYKLDDILLYFITMDSGQLHSFVQDKTNSDKSEYLQSKQIPCNIVVPSSIFIFHSMNSIYLIFREMTLVSSLPKYTIDKKEKTEVNAKVKSCLKTNTGSGSDTKKTTKRVRICDDNVIRRTMKCRETV